VAANGTNGNRATTRERILVVDDEQTIREILSKYITQLGYEVVTAEDGMHALEKLAALPFDLVLTDLKMPKMDGRELLKRLAEAYPDIPKIVLTGLGTDEDIILALKTGAYDFLTKPIIDFEILHHALKRALERKRLNDERTRYADQQTHITEIVSMLNRGSETEEIFKTLSTTLKRFIPFNRLTLALIDETTGSVVTKYIESDQQVLLGRGEEFPLERSSLNDAAERKVVIIINDLERYYTEHASSVNAKRLLEEGMRSSLVLPLIINDRTRGFLIFASVTPHSFKEDHISFLESIVGQISFSIQRGELLSELETHTEKLEQLVETRTREVLKTQKVTIFALSKLADARDVDTGQHLERIRRFCALIAQVLKYSEHGKHITNQYLRDLYDSSILHDIGKVGIPDAILLKQGPLTAEEFDIIKTHTTIGFNSLRSASKDLGEDTFLNMAMDITLYHHERWDGLGYPYGLKGDEIPLSSRIVAISDVYDALTSKRPYKAPYEHEMAVEIMKDEQSHFDPLLFKIFLENNEEIDRIRREFK